MPIQSIASYISSMTSLAIIFLIALFLFLIIFLLSRLLVKSAKKGRTNEHIKSAKQHENRVVLMHKDPNLVVNMSAIALFFLISIIFIFLLIMFLILTEILSVKINLVFLAVIFIFLIASSVYTVKSGIFK